MARFVPTFDEEGGPFRLEYDKNRGHKPNTRLDALSCEQALREAKDYLEIGEDDRDPAGAQWGIEYPLLPEKERRGTKLVPRLSGMKCLD